MRSLDIQLDRVPTCITMNYMKGSALTVRLEKGLQKKLEGLCRKLGRSRSDVVREAIEKRVDLLRFEDLRKRLIPYAEAKGILTDEDVFREIS